MNYKVVIGEEYAVYAITSLMYSKVFKSIDDVYQLQDSSKVNKTVLVLFHKIIYQINNFVDGNGDT